MNEMDILALIKSLRHMTTQCEQVKALLANDREYFVKNDIVSLEQSNAKKIECLDHLRDLMDVASKNKLDAILQDESVNPVTQTKLKELIAELKVQITDCYQFITLNTQLVFSNIKNMKTMLDRLSKSKHATLYDRMGNQVK